MPFVLTDLLCVEIEARYFDVDANAFADKGPKVCR
jgi:hypothetical protein